MTYKLDLDILPLDLQLHAKSKVCPSVCSPARVLTDSQIYRLTDCQNYCTFRVTDAGCKYASTLSQPNGPMDFYQNSDFLYWQCHANVIFTIFTISGLQVAVTLARTLPPAPQTSTLVKDVVPCFEISSNSWNTEITTASQVRHYVELCATKKCLLGFCHCHANRSLDGAGWKIGGSSKDIEGIEGGSMKEIFQHKIRKRNKVLNCRVFQTGLLKNPQVDAISKLKNDGRGPPPLLA